MARPRKAEAPAPTKTLEAQLWAAADQMRGAVPPTDYMHVSLGLVFLRYLSAPFEAKHTELLNTPYADPEDPEDYQADSVFWVPPQSRWSTLAANARSADIGQRIDDAMRGLEANNDGLRGVLPQGLRQARRQPIDAGRPDRSLHQPQPHRCSVRLRPAGPGVRVLPCQVLGNSRQVGRWSVHATWHRCHISGFDLGSSLVGSTSSSGAWVGSFYYYSVAG